MTRPDLTVERLRHTITPRLLQVARITELSPAMRRVTLVGPDLEGFHSPSFDDHVKLFLPVEQGAKPVMPVISPEGLEFPADAVKPVARDYTPRRYDEAAQELDIDFVLHHSGPATDWATNVSVGDYLGIGGPRGSFVIPVGFDWHLLIGDEAALPAIGRRLEELPPETKAIVLVKTRDAASRIELHPRCEARIEWLLDEPGYQGTAAEIDALEKAVRALELPKGEGYIWAAGEYTAIQRVREHLVKERGVDKNRIRAASYWRRKAPATHVNFE